MVNNEKKWKKAQVSVSCTSTFRYGTMMKIAASTTLRHSRQLRNVYLTNSRAFGTIKNTAKPFSTAQLKVEEDLEAPSDAAASSTSSTTPENIAAQSNIADTVPDFTSDKTKIGTPSPWAVFDAWGAGSNLYDDALTDAEMSRLEKE